MKFEKAQILDASKLTELTIRSKAHWNYSPQQIESWRQDLTITEKYIENTEVYKLTQVNQLIGYYSFFNEGNGKVKLDNIFVEPQFMGQGFGRTLMDHFFQKIKDIGFESIVLDSEPYAEAFYLKLGFIVTGRLESSIKNRYLPIMELDIKSIQYK